MVNLTPTLKMLEEGKKEIKNFIEEHGLFGEFRGRYETDEEIESAIEDAVCFIYQAMIQEFNKSNKE